MVSTVWSVSCLLFYSRSPLPRPAICKSGRHVPPVPYGIGATANNILILFYWVVVLLYRERIMNFFVLFLTLLMLITVLHFLGYRLFSAKTVYFYDM